MKKRLKPSEIKQSENHYQNVLKNTFVALEVKIKKKYTVVLKPEM